jgi:hypothetical protein
MRIRPGAIRVFVADYSTSATTSLANTIKAILKDHGIEPAPERRTKLPWKTFLAAHWDGLAAADFFTVEVLTMAGLIRYVVLFVMKLKTRTVEIAGISHHPDENWMTQVARNVTNAEMASYAARIISFWTGTLSTPQPSAICCGTAV